NISTNAGNIAANTATMNTNSANIASLQQLTSTQQGQINTLFGETASNRAAIDRANEGVAMALAMESPMLPAGTNFGLSGGVGYFEDQGAGTIALSARIGENAAFSAGVGVGFDSGEIGARGGFQVAW
ncbi:MAG: YadA-like family protein, partial [Alteripontixanthobacter sp.]